MISPYTKWYISDGMLWIWPDRNTKLTEFIYLFIYFGQNKMRAKNKSDAN